MPPDTITSIFKESLARANKICSEKYFIAEIEYLTDIFCKNGRDRETLQKIISNFETKALSDNNDNNNNTDKNQTITSSWIPKIGPEIKNEIQKFGFRVAFQTSPSLKNIFCKTKDKLIPNSYPGVYELKFSFGTVFNGETKKQNY